MLALLVPGVGMGGGLATPTVIPPLVTSAVDFAYTQSDATEFARTQTDAVNYED